MYNCSNRFGIGTSNVFEFEYRESYNIKRRPNIIYATKHFKIRTKWKYTKSFFMIDKSQFKKAPEFTGISGFINTPVPIKLSDLKGKVVLVHFWTYTCINCIHTIPHLNDWYQKYSNKGLVIVGVQTPEFSDEKNIDNVKTAVNKFQIKYPVILDNNYASWNAYGNNYWPRDYVVDNQGYIRYNHIGEGDYNQTEQMIQSLLAEGVIT
jgi:thiol-disulfide isomerase/thioredoxin